jgi:dTDP-4-dehydrorhamnose reductase
MLGHEMVRVLKESGLSVQTAGRSSAEIPFDVENADFTGEQLTGFDYVVNCIGLTTHNIDELEPESARAANLLNAEFPKLLAEFAFNSGTRVIQIATDCVFSGTKGGYTETDLHDAQDVYGTTKSKGEVSSPVFMHLRSSIIGRELKGKKSLLEWVNDQPKGAVIPGFTDRLWNGVTTTAFSKVVAGVILEGTFKAGVWHLIPANALTKAQLVEAIAKSLGRTDLEIAPEESGTPKDLTLATNHPDFNQLLWNNAGYQSIPAIEELLNEISG